LLDSDWTVTGFVDLRTHLLKELGRNRNGERMRSFSSRHFAGEVKKAGLNHPLKLKIPTGWPQMFSQGVRASMRWRPSHRNLMEIKALMELKSKDWCWLSEVRRYRLMSKRHYV
jgi:hypothetical protein